MYIVIFTKLCIPRGLLFFGSTCNNNYDCTVRCELCGGANVPPPLAAHMRNAHPGCRSPTNRGYDRAGVYKRADSPVPVDIPAAACGQLAHGTFLFVDLHHWKFESKQWYHHGIKQTLNCLLKKTLRLFWALLALLKNLCFIKRKLN